MRYSAAQMDLDTFSKIGVRGLSRTGFVMVLPFELVVNEAFECDSESWQAATGNGRKLRKTRGKPEESRLGMAKGRPAGRG